MRRAIIQAGGLGTRLRPYSTVLPKPLMPIGDAPILEILIRQLVSQGVVDITVTLGYLGELITAVVGDGSQWGAHVTYVREDEPLGTIGPVTLVDDLEGPFFVMNGDLLTDFDFRSFMTRHVSSGADLSIGVYSKEVQISLGVFDMDEKNTIVGFSEKPTYEFPCSMGIYAFNPDMLDLIPRRSQYGFDDLILMCLDKGLSVQAHRHDGLWLDIGRPEDYELAAQVFAGNRNRFLPEFADVAAS